MKIRLLLLLLGFATLAFAQKPNSSLRFPVSPDMPAWAVPLYHDDVEVNVFELDLAFKPWKLTFDSLKLEMAHAGDNASDALRQPGFYPKIRQGGAPAHQLRSG
jgi:hypothetical protein